MWIVTATEIEYMQSRARRDQTMNNDWALIINISYKYDKVVRLNGYTRKCPQLAAAYIITCPDRLDSD